jgi:hypothetical protein
VEYLLLQKPIEEEGICFLIFLLLLKGEEQGENTNIVVLVKPAYPQSNTGIDRLAR